jgi:DNA topoisomerase-6 subunit B
VIGTNWRAYGLTQSRGSFPSGPITVMIHMASVWVPFTSESKEAVAAYPEIEKELRLALQAVGRKLGMYVRRRDRVKQEGERRSIFLRYLGEVATAVGKINGADAKKLYERLLAVAKRKTAEADARFDDRGRKLEEEDAEGYGEHVLIVDADDDTSVAALGDVTGASAAASAPGKGKKGKRGRRAEQEELPLQ